MKGMLEEGCNPRLTIVAGTTGTQRRLIKGTEPDKGLVVNSVVSAIGIPEWQKLLGGKRA